MRAGGARRIAVEITLLVGIGGVSRAETPPQATESFDRAAHRARASYVSLLRFRGAPRAFDPGRDVSHRVIAGVLRGFYPPSTGLLFYDQSDGLARWLLDGAGVRAWHRAALP